MQSFTEAFNLAASLLLEGNKELLEIVFLSLKISTLSTVIGCIIGFPLGAIIVIYRFPGRRFTILMINTLMGLPPVVVGLVVYLLLSNAGPMGTFKLLYTQIAMIIAQTILITPIVAALSRQVVESLYEEYEELFTSLLITKASAIFALLWDARYSLLTIGLAGFGRAISEVGAVMIVGGNIAHVTRVMTTAIASETAKGDLALALALGMILISITFLVNGCAMLLRGSKYFSNK
ncbi:MAG: ABC transporter permease [Rhodobiaceae bacterium]|jgi:tungstate transport system permease protein|nr:ABC transporter permease [Rhodobiaceae bacterium]MDB4831130.1 ABC transporter permease [Hyphomicrobiales bacterium]MDC3272074.1 ABC transporter permease [Hyphomicrobiales bacterium]